MPPEISADMQAALTPEELAAIADDQPSAEELAAMQRIAAGAPDDDDGDEDDDDGASSAAAAPIEGQGAAPEAGAAGDAADSDGHADDAGAQASPEALPEAVPAPVAAAPTYEAQLPSDYDDQVKALADKEAELKAQFKGGEIEFEDFEAQRGELLKQREDLTLARAKAEISQEMSQQSAQAQWRATVESFVAGAAKEPQGIDYRKDTAKQADLDQFVKVLAAREDNADKPMAWFLTEAHKRVKALHGLADAAPTHKADPAAAVKAAADARKPPVAAAPVTLAQVPGSDGPGDVASEFADLDALEGEALEAAISKLSPAQREKWARGR